jgi:GntR family transcriptional regulator
LTSTNADARPLYTRVADALRRGIERGEYAPGDPIPSEADLQRQYNVSRDTIRKALAALTQEGLIGGGQGRTRFVRSYAPLRWALSSFESRSHHEAVLGSTLDAWSTEVQDQGRRPSETIEVNIALPSDRVAERLRIDASKDLVVVRRRVRYVDDVPYQLADSYFPESLVRGTPLIEPRSVSARGGVLASIGHPQARYVDEIAVRMPTRTETDRLDLPPGTPVAELTRTGYAADDRPLRVMVTIAPGDRNILVYELDAS